MSEITTIGVDLAKSVFQVHGVDAAGEVVVRRQLRRAQVAGFFGRLAPCVVGMEACASSHHWARVLQGLGHEVRLMPPHYVKPYVKRNKNDAADAEAICEAVGRPTMRFVAVKSAEQQSLLMVHRTRSLLIRQRTMLVNALRGHLTEYGVVAAVGRRGLATLLAVVADDTDVRVPSLARDCLAGLAAALATLASQIAAADRRIAVWHRGCAKSRRLARLPSLGPVGATAMVATVSDPKMFGSGRELAAWIGLVPRQSATGGKQRLGRISKQGDRYLRSLLVSGAMAVIRQGRRNGFADMPWLGELVARKPAKVAAVALANKTARAAWAMLSSGEDWRAPTAAG